MSVGLIYYILAHVVVVFIGLAAGKQFAAAHPEYVSAKYDYHTDPMYVEP